jgi:threonine/homoserine/homoserine lactone efflux protein
MSTIIAMVLFSISMCITPGPNNLLALSSGVNYGFYKTLPFALGVMIGTSLLTVVIALGLAELVTENKRTMEYLGYAGILFIFYMSYKIAMAAPELKTRKTEGVGFIHGFFFQCLNTKGWIARFAAVSAFSLTSGYKPLITYVSIYMVIVFCSVSTWAFVGSRIARFLKTNRNLQIFNITMGVSLALVAVYLLVKQILSY